MTRLDTPTNIVSHFAVMLCAASLVIGLASSAVADEEETRLSQPVLKPIPNEIEREAAEEVPPDGAPKDRATIFGATVVEARESRAIITDVAIGSPAAKAGLREGDEIISVAGFRGDSYEEWLEGVQRIVRDTPDGETVPVAIKRGGKRLTVQVRTLIASPGEGSIASGRPLVNVPDVGPGVATQPRQQNIGIGGSDDDIFISNADFFGDDALGGRPDERAIAHIYMIPAAQPAPQTPGVQTPGAQTPGAQTPGGRRSAVGAPNAPALDPATAIDASAQDVRQSSAGGFGQGRGVAGARIGLAGFRNREQGMMVMVDVGNLPAGNYLVAVADPGVISGASGTPGTSAVQDPLEQQTVDQTPGVNQATPGNRPVERNVQPRQRRQPSSIGTPQQERLQQPLRQQLSGSDGQAADDQDSGLSAPPTGEVNPLSAPPTGEANELTAPPTGEVNQLSAPPTGEVNELSARPTGQLDQTAATGGRSATGGAAGAPGVVAPIAPLTVDRSGTGRLQQVVEGIQVADVVGLAIVIYTEAVPPANPIPPGGNLVDAARPQQRGAAQQPAAAVAAPQGPMPVAAGLIRMTESGADGAAPAATGQRQPNTSAPGARQSRSQ